MDDLFPSNAVDQSIPYIIKYYLLACIPGASTNHVTRFALGSFAI